MTSAVARRLVVGLEGPWPTAEEFSWLTEWRPAGVILFSRNIKDNNQLRELCNVLHGQSPGLEVMGDHEGGPVSHLAAAIGRPPSAWSLGVIDDVGLTARVFAETGLRMKAAGLDRMLGPVADVLTEPTNPVIGCRAFGADSALVTRHTVAAVAGLLKADLKVCLKHWPGHGGTKLDTHRSPACTDDKTVSAPFAGGLRAGADAVMVGHLGRSVDGGGPGFLPATLDRDFLAGSRRDWAAAGCADAVLFADDVSMGALGPAMAALGVRVPNAEVSGLFDPADLPGEWFDRLVSAGCDRVLIRALPRGAFPVGQATAAPPRPVATDDAFPGEPAAYREARIRQWAIAGRDFHDPEADLCWLDFTAGDRWQVASGERDGGLPALRALLRSRFRSVVEPRRDGAFPAGCNRLLVTSHRSVALPGVADLNLASSGHCLVMGHPDLARRLGHVLGPGWRIGALFDVNEADLFPDGEASTNI
jgi:hypothetical protein